MPHILITGASSGIGAALARLYAAPGARLSLHGRSAERLAAVAAEAERRGASVTVSTGDVTDAKAMEAWINAADAAQPLDLVIANAGMSGGTSGLNDERAQAERIFAVNLNGVLNTAAPAASLMAARRRGQIALVSSLAGFRGFAGTGAYAASKAAARIYGESLRADLAPFHVGVSVICPGFVKTPMTDVNPFSMPFIMSAERAAGIIKRGLDRNRARIAFPGMMHLMVNCLALLPVDFVARLLRGRPRKPPFDAAG